MSTKIATQQPVEEAIIRENHRPAPHQSSNYLHNKNIKKGVERLERHPSSGFNPSPKKSGKGGRFTWEGPHDFPDESEARPLDKKDPNYVDDEQEFEEANKPQAPTVASKATADDHPVLQ